MELCGICGEVFKTITHTHLKMHGMTVKEYLATFPQAKISWNQGETKETDCRVAAIADKAGKSRKGKYVGHPNYYSREYVGDKFDEIEQKRREKIGKTVVEKGVSSRGGKKGIATRRTLPNFGYSDESLKKLSETMSENRKNGVCKTWNKGLSKLDDERLMKLARKLSLFPDGGREINRRRFTPEVRMAIGTRDNFECQFCGSAEKLVIHHVNLDKGDNDLDNLILLCRSCHTKIHAPVLAELRKELSK